MKTSLVLAFVALTLRADDAAGHYVLHAHEVGSELMLNADGTFEYMLAYGAADYWAKGAWRRQDGSVILTSAGKKEPPFRLLRSATGQGDVIRVWVMGQNGRPVPNIDVGLRTAKGDAEARTSSDGAAEFPASGQPIAVSFRIAVYNLQTGPFEVNSAHHDFYFEINGDAITQVHFEDERLPMDGKDLLLRYWDKDKPMRYERQ